MNKNKFYEILMFASENKISDLHIWEDQKVFIRNSIWEMEQIDFTYSREEIYGFTNDILPSDKIDALLNWYEIDTAYSFADARFRINIYNDKIWINIALRRIQANPPTLEEIDIPKYLEKNFLKDKWLILVTWATWSWKTTTLAAILRFISENKKCHIITLEDPIEYIINSDHSRIVQREVWKNTHSWNDWIKYALRQDPDVIMIWEMRDLESIASVLTLVETGHLVLATLHTSDAMHSLTRIIDAFPPHQQAQIATQLSLSLELVISQKLLPQKQGTWLVAAREIMINNSAIANLTREKKFPNIYSVMETQLWSWMVTMDHSLARLVAMEKIENEIAITKVKNAENFPSLIEFYKSRIYSAQQKQNDSKK